MRLHGTLTKTSFYFPVPDICDAWISRDLFAKLEMRIIIVNPVGLSPA